MVEAICSSVHTPYEVISSEDLLARIEDFNKKIEAEKSNREEGWDWRNEWTMIGSDVVSLFPSLTAVETAKAVRSQAMKCSIKWDNIDSRWLRLYVHLNQHLSSDITPIKHLLPKKRKGKRGPEPSLSSKECLGRHLENVYDDGIPSSWTWPETETTQ